MSMSKCLNINRIRPQIVSQPHSFLLQYQLQSFDWNFIICFINKTSLHGFWPYLQHERVLFETHSNCVSADDVFLFTEKFDKTIVWCRKHLSWVEHPHQFFHTVTEWVRGLFCAEFAEYWKYPGISKASKVHLNFKLFHVSYVFKN